MKMFSKLLISWWWCSVLPEGPRARWTHGILPLPCMGWW